MSQTDSANTTTLRSAEYRRLVYLMFRKEGMTERGGRLHRLPAVKAWRLARLYPHLSLARRYAEALS